MSSAICRSPIDTASQDSPRRSRVRHVILDRDGVLNREAAGGGYVTSAEQWEWLPGALGALAEMTRAGFRLSVATNQSAVGRGLMTLQDLDAVHERMVVEAAGAGARLSAILFCPHAPGADCSCRKPAPGLIQRAVAASDMSAGEALVVGDDVRDLEAAEAAGVAAALVLTGKGQRSAGWARGAGVAVYEDLADLARHLVAEDSARTGEPIV